MIFVATKLQGAFILDLKRMEDEQGFYAHTFCAQEYEKYGLDPMITQCSLFRSEKKFTLKGFHYQKETRGAKTIRCIRGSMLGVIIDLRKDSPTYCESLSIELSAKNYRALYIPEHFAHAFITLEERSEVFYHTAGFLAPEGEKGIRWNDPYFNIEWPTHQPILSVKDQAYPDFLP